MFVEAERIILERIAAGGIRPLAPQIGYPPADTSPASEFRERYGRAYDPDKLTRWQEGLSRVLERYEREQVDTAHERAYIAAGLKARRSAPFAMQDSRAEEDTEKLRGRPDREEASSITGQKLTEAESREVQQLKARDREVRAHEQAHIGAGGGLTMGGPSYSKKTGPDGKQYAVGGQVQIDTSEADTPEATIAKAQRVRAAALAPAQPSSQDHQVAAKASQMEAAARQELATQKAEDTEEESVSTQQNIHMAQTEELAPNGMPPGRRATLAYERVSGALPPVPLALGQEVSLAV